jgi:hypothetical protein
MICVKCTVRRSPPGPPSESAAFHYFLHTCNPENGLVADTTRANAPASIAAVGFALSSYPVAVERAWLTSAAARTLVTLRFFRNSTQDTEPHATGYKGFYYHFLDMRSGKRVWQSELSLTDTTLLLVGILVVSAYVTENTPEEEETRELADETFGRLGNAAVTRDSMS